MRKYKPLTESELELVKETTNQILRVDMKNVQKSGIESSLLSPKQVNAVCKAIHLINVAFKEVNKGGKICKYLKKRVTK